ncbi:FAD:protein FMN transferase [Sandaracinobacteroides hominis]|uniref:FAD:protein FMN transferase n=1 Tax=Sandaracinobacteroides hominis TaxID=2780086 RepID=UPI002E2B261F|nr:FAD:protein FMN transferase [Sandaracinobacteroides hominis]
MTSWEPRVAIPRDLSPDLFAGVAKGAQVRRMGGATMGTEWSLSLVGGGAEVRPLVEAVLAEVIAESSLWESDSEISRFNRAKAGERIALSPGFDAVIGCALQLAAESGGAFDPCIGRLSAHWGFGPDGAQASPPPAAAASLELVDGALTQPGGVWLDLNGIAKGQAVDRAAEALLASGIRQFLIGIGGEYRGEGVRPDGQPWWVEIEQPPGAALRPLRTALSGFSIATSGDYRRAFHRDGRRLSHSIDPHTGEPIPEGIASVAVLGKSCMLADGEATAITVLGAEEGLRWATGRNLAAQILIREGQRFREILTPALLEML